MNQDEAFMRAIIEDPDDDSVRLIYADWMIEQGRHDRAEFIQVQVALAQERKKPGWTPTPQEIEHYGAQDLQALFRCNNCDRENRIDDLRRREKELLAVMPSESPEDPNRAEGWTGGSVRNHWGLQAFAALKSTGLLYSRPTEPSFDWEFRRGFIEAVVISLEDFEKHRDVLCACAPIKEVGLTASPEISFEDKDVFVEKAAFALLALKYPGIKFSLAGR